MYLPQQLKESIQTVVASIVTWNHAHCIESCVQSLLNQTFESIEIVISDNASSDGTRDVLEKFRDRVRLIYNSENIGFCGGHNAVISATSSDFVLLVNPDIVLREDYVAKAVERIKSDAAIGTICGLLIQNDSDAANCLIDGTGLTVARNRRFCLRHHGMPLASTPLQAGDVFGCDGALPLYRRQMIEATSINGMFFDEIFFAHKEDHDVSWRAQLYGWTTIFEPACIAVHPRAFRPGNLQLRSKLAPHIKYHAVKNDLLLLLKNEDASNFWKDFFYIVPRRVGILLYTLIREPQSLKAYWFILRNFQVIWNRRRLIHKNRKTSPASIRARFKLGA